MSTTTICEAEPCENIHEGAGPEGLCEERIERSAATVKGTSVMKVSDREKRRGFRPRTAAPRAERGRRRRRAREGGHRRRHAHCPEHDRRQPQARKESTNGRRRAHLKAPCATSVMEVKSVNSAARDRRGLDCFAVRPVVVERELTGRVRHEHEESHPQRTIAIPACRGRASARRRACTDSPGAATGDRRPGTRRSTEGSLAFTASCLIAPPPELVLEHPANRLGQASDEAKCQAVPQALRNPPRGAVEEVYEIGGLKAATVSSAHGRDLGPHAALRPTGLDPGPSAPRGQLDREEVGSGDRGRPQEPIPVHRPVRVDVELAHFLPEVGTPEGRGLEDEVEVRKRCRSKGLIQSHDPVFRPSSSMYDPRP